MHLKRAFTLLEILIVVAIISIIAIGTIILLDPLTMVNKGVDAERKSDLTTFRKKMEEFYNDKNCYPRLDEVCFQGGKNGTLNLFNPYSAISCIMCGTEAASPQLTSYMDKLPCDPRYATGVYMYAIRNKSEKDCPKSYALYTTLDVLMDNDGLKLGCGEGGCGISPNFGYDYGVTSPNGNVSVTGNFVCLTNTNTCDDCGGYETCVETCMGNVYSSFTACNNAK